MTRPLEYLEAEIPGRPITWGRPVDTGGRRLNPARYRAWREAAVPALAAAARLRSFDGEVAVSIDLWPDRVEVRVSALDPDDTRRPGTGIAGDVDNYAKAVLDALQAAGVLTDDKTVADLRVRIRPERSPE